MPIISDGGSNKIGTTKVFSSEHLTDQQIYDYAQSLTGGKPLMEAPNAPGRFYAKLTDESTINLRNISKSVEETQARWTIDIIQSPKLQQYKKIELKFR